MPKSGLETSLRVALIHDWGYVVGSAGLRQVLGYPTQAALRAAVARGVIPVRVFEIRGRKGQFALAHDLAAWLAANGAPDSPSDQGRRGGAVG